MTSCSTNLHDVTRRGNPWERKRQLAVAVKLNNQADALHTEQRFAEAEPLYQRALAIREQRFGPHHPQTATIIHNLASLYEDMGRHTEAEALCQRALAIREKQLGPDHPDTVSSINDLAVVYEAMGRYTEAEPLLKRALTIRETQLEPNHLDTATSLNNLAVLCKSMGNYNRAEPLQRRALAIHEKQLGSDEPSTATSINNLALLYKFMGRYEEAAPLYKRALAIRANQLGPDHPDTSASLNNLAGLYRSTGAYAEAERLYQRSLTSLERRFGTNHPGTAYGLDNLAGLYGDMARYAEAETLHQRALAIREGHLGPIHPATASSLNNLAALYKDLGRYSDAEPLYKRSLGIFEELLGPDHPSIASNLNNLAALYQEMARYAEAEPLYQRSLAIREKQLGSEHPDTASSLNNLASLYESMGRYSEAEPLLQRALAIRERHLGPDHPDTASSLNNLGALYNTLSRSTEAKTLYQRALAIRERQLGPDHPSTASSLNNLAALYESMGRYSEAEPLVQRALTIRENQFGPDHPDTATSLNNLASLHESMGRYDDAESLFERALVIFEQRVGPDHPNTSSTLSNLATLYKDMGRHIESLTFGIRAMESTRKHTATILPYFAEHELVSYGQSLSIVKLAGNVGDGPMALQSQLWFKSMVAEQMVYRKREFSLLRNLDGGPALAAKLDDLRAQIQAVSLLHGENSGLVQDLRKQFEEKRRKVRERLGSQAGEGLMPGLSLALKDVSQNLTPGQVLVESFRYTHRLMHDKSEPRYVSALLSPTGEAVRVDLGPAEALEIEIKEFRRLAMKLDLDVQALPAGRRDEQMREVSQRLYQALIAPLLPTLEKWGADTLLISPDAQLNFLPWDMLLDQPGEGGQIAATKLNFRYLSSGRDLVIEPASTRPSTEGLLVANPAYDLDAPAALAGTSTLHASDLKNVLLSGLGKDSQSIGFHSVAGLAQVQRDLPGIFARHGQTMVSLAGKKATEPGLLKALSGQRVVHLATHGFFLNEIKIGPEKDDRFQALKLDEEETGRGPVLVQDPMFRSGLALAGAQNTLARWKKGEVPAPAGDGMLLAAEAAALNLSGTDVLFLGACETAVGESLNGEGVMGLRRALAIAGARNAILTLWPVLDQPTVEFTEAFYEKYLGGLSAPTALAETKKELFARWMQTDGYAEAVRKAGPFVCTSVGPVR